jgi:signal transduction histidine kinase
MIKQNADGIFVVGEDRIIHFVNPVACSLFGLKQEEFVGELFEFPAVVGEAVEIEIIREGGEHIVAEMRTSESEWEGRSVKLISLRDITQRKLMENKLKEANERLQEFNQLKDEFVSTISHELRTPLSITMGAIRLVLNEVSGRIVDEQREVLTTAMENIKRLGSIVESLLSISAIESGKVELRKKIVNICKLIEDTVSDYKTLAQKKGVSLDYEVPDQSIDICLDPDRTREVLINLISNSIKFTPKGGWIKVTCSGQEQEVQICVQDSGVGISKDDIPQLFDKFTQFDRKNGPGEKGTGLGLAIVKKLIELHSGKVEVESEVNHGTTFTISLPLAAEAAAENPSAEANELVEHTIANR